MVVSKEKISEIYEVLPKMNCGLCGFSNCGQFARAVAEGEASPFGCRQNPWLVYRISEIIGVQAPAYSYGYQPTSVHRSGTDSSSQDLKEQVRKLSQSVDNVLARIENLKVRK